MSQTLAIAGREFRAVLLSPAGYIVTALYALFACMAFVFFAFDQGRPASMRVVFEASLWLLMFVCPAISMKAIAEGRRMGTFEMLMTSPVREGQVIVGKFLGCLGFLVIILLPTLIPVLVLEMYGRPDYGEVLCGYLGLLLVGSAYLATGIFASTVTISQAAAFLMTLFFWLILGVGTRTLTRLVGPPWSEAVFAADPDPRLRDFAIGLIDSANVVYFVSFTAVFLIIAVKSLEIARWR